MVFLSGMQSYTFKKAERLCSKNLINNLFAKGNRVTTQFPFRILWQVVAQPQWEFPAQVMISVSKRNFAAATNRNRIKRQLRELYRLNKHILYQQLDKQELRIILAINYQAKELLTSEQLKPAFEKTLQKLMSQIANIPDADKSAE